MDSEENEIVEIETPQPTSSLVERLTNVIVSPGEVFGALKGRPVDPLNWAVPMVIAILGGILFSVTVFSQEGVVEGMLQAQEAEFDKLVEKGELTASQAESARKNVESFMNPKLLMLFSIAASIFFTPVVWLVVAFFFHWLAKIGSRSHIPFTKCFEVVGLCSIISVLGILVNLLLVVITGNLSMSLSLALMFQEYDPTDKIHALAAEVDLMRIWYISILAVAWSRLTHHPVATCGAWLFGIWLAFRVGWITLFL